MIQACLWNGEETWLMRTMCICVEQRVLEQMSSVSSNYEEPRKPGWELEPGCGDIYNILNNINNFCGFFMTLQVMWEYSSQLILLDILSWFSSVCALTVWRIIKQMNKPFSASFIPEVNWSFAPYWHPSVSHKLASLSCTGSKVMWTFLQHDTTKLNLMNFPLPRIFIIRSTSPL